MNLKCSRETKIFISILLLVHIIYFLLACKFTRIYMGDSFEYIYEALNIKNYFFFYSGNPAMPIEPEYMTQRQPGYPLFLLSVYLFTVNNWIVIILQNLLSIFNILYCRIIFTRLMSRPAFPNGSSSNGMVESFNKKYDWLFLLFIIAYPSQFINANTIAPDILLQTFAVLYFGNFVKLWQEKQLKNALIMSLALVAGMMVKPVFYPFAIIHFIIILSCFIKWKSKLQRPLLVALFPVFIVLLYNYSNLTRTGKFHFSSNQSFNAIYYFYTYFSHTKGADSANNFLSKERATMASFSEFQDRYDYANKKGLKLLKENWCPYLLFHLQNSLRIFIEPGKAEMDLFTGKLTYGQLYSKQQTGFYVMWKNKGWNGLSDYIKHNASMPFVILVFLFNCFRLIGIIFFFLGRKATLGIRIFIFIYLSYFAIAAGPIANTRYFLPVSLIAIGCAAMGLKRKGV